MAEVTEDTYEFLQQFFRLFPKFQANEFYIFGESYGGKYAPSLAKKIHDEMMAAPFEINLQGIGVGNGFVSPQHTAVYADLLHQVGLIDENVHEKMLEQEEHLRSFAQQDQYLLAHVTWNNIMNTMTLSTGCHNLYLFTQCEMEPEDNNVDAYVQRDDVRSLLHVGHVDYNISSPLVLLAMQGDYMRSELQTYEFLLERYRVLLYNGNLDIICNHRGILNMFSAMQSWSGLDEYYSAPNDIYRVDGQVAGYLKSEHNLRLLSVRNAGHSVPKYQPRVALDMLDKFVGNTL